MRIAWLVLVGVLVASPASAEMIFAGAGAKKCELVNANVPAGTGYTQNAFTMSLITWVQGFVSGMNAARGASVKKFYDLDSISIDEQWAFVVAYCRGNSEQAIYMAATELMFKRLVDKPLPK